MTMMKRLSHRLVLIISFISLSLCVLGKQDDLFINFGGDTFTDTDGNKWVADTQFNIPGFPFKPRLRPGIRGSAKNDEEMYQTERWSNGDMVINIPVENQKYEVNLHFAEIWADSVNVRVFDVYVQGLLVLNDLDIFALVGKNTALTIDAESRVSNGMLTIVLKRNKQNPKISGVEIRAIPEIDLENFRPIYINCGGGALTDNSGRSWLADSSYRGGRTWRPSDARQFISETANMELYRAERFQFSRDRIPNLRYEIPVPKGAYKVTLHFAENFPGAFGKNKRVFDVAIEGYVEIDKLDIYDEVGSYHAMSRDVPAYVSDGQLSIEFIPRISNPKISAIEVHAIPDVYKWNTYGQPGLTLVVLNALNDNKNKEWLDVFQGAITAWNGNDSDALRVLRVEVPHDPDCKAAPGRIKVCNDNYGRTGWVGLNTVTLRNNYIMNSNARMNDYYLDIATDAQKKYAMCHELGHAFGLPHTDESYYNEDLGDCLDYTVRPENNQAPGKYNFDMLKQLYGLPGRGRSLTVGDLNLSEDVLSTPEDDRALEKLGDDYDDIIIGSETMSCQELVDGAPGHVIAVAETSEGEEYCEFFMPGGVTVQIRKLLAWSELEKLLDNKESGEQPQP